MRLAALSFGRQVRALAQFFAMLLIGTCLFFVVGDRAFAQRVFGLDTSSVANPNGPPSQTQWNNAFNDADGDGIAYKFAFVRASRGGTSDATRFDDPHFYTNVTRATNAGLLVGSYHFARLDVFTHDGVDDAEHYLEWAGMYMKPGYLLPVFDLESGNSQRTTPEMTAWGMDFMDTMFEATGFYPIVYTSSSYNNDEVTAQLAFFDFNTTPKSQPRTYQWLARPSGSLTSGEPGAAGGYPNPYGVWDPNFAAKINSRDPAINPWNFWQNGFGTPNGFLIDNNAANGNIEFVKDFLVPALWTKSGGGDWATVGNWNSDNSDYDGSIESGPAPRLPNNQNLDWVKLQNLAGGTVTISSGAQTVRKFYTEQPLNITGGSLSVAYLPGAGGKWDVPAEFKAAVTLSSGAGYSAHTTQIDGGGGTFNLNGGTVTFSEIQLASHASNAGKIVVGGDVTFANPGGAGTSVIRSTGALSHAGSISLSGGNRKFNVNDGAAAVDLDVRAEITGAGRLVKNGLGTMQLSESNSYTGGTTVSNGVLQLTAENQLGATPGSPQADNIVLDGGILRTGARVNALSLTNPGSGYKSFPTLTIAGAGANVQPASANVLAGITDIAVTNGGTNYVNQTPSAPPSPNTPGTFVDIVGGGGTGATAYATVVNGVVTGITIANPGAGYTSMPTIHISSTISAGNQAGKDAAAVANGIALQGLALNHGGFDYSLPTVALTGGGGTGATASATSSPVMTFNANRGITLGSGGGELRQAAFTTLSISGPITSNQNGGLTKSGLGLIELAGANTYTGGTTLNAGALVLSGAAATLGTGNVAINGTSTGSFLAIESGVQNGISDSATLNLLGGGVAGVADQNFVKLGAGIDEKVGALFLAGIQQSSGKTYGSTASGAIVQSDEFFSGTGVISIGLVGDYNADFKVDTADYIVWRNSDGSPEGFRAWQRNFGVAGTLASTSGAAAEGGAVPEPSIALLVMLAAGTVACDRRRR